MKPKKENVHLSTKKKRGIGSSKGNAGKKELGKPGTKSIQNAMGNVAKGKGKGNQAQVKKTVSTTRPIMSHTLRKNKVAGISFPSPNKRRNRKKMSDTGATVLESVFSTPEFKDIDLVEQAIETGSEMLAGGQSIFEGEFGLLSSTNREPNEQTFDEVQSNSTESAKSKAKVSSFTVQTKRPSTPWAELQRQKAARCKANREAQERAQRREEARKAEELEKKKERAAAAKLEYKQAIAERGRNFIKVQHLRRRQALLQIQVDEKKAQEEFEREKAARTNRTMARRNSLRKFREERLQKERNKLKGVKISNSYPAMNEHDDPLLFQEDLLHKFIGCTR